MPAKSKAQQRLMGMAYAYAKGELPGASKEVKELAKSMSKKDLKEFAKTKHKGLPEKVKKKKKKKSKKKSSWESRLSKLAAVLQDLDLTNEANTLQDLIGIDTVGLYADDEEQESHV